MTEVAPPVAVTVDGPTWLSMETYLDGLTPSEVLTWFAQPDKLRQWWGQENEIDSAPVGPTSCAGPQWAGRCAARPPW